MKIGLQSVCRKMLLRDLMMVRRNSDTMRNSSRLHDMNKIAAHAMSDFQDFLARHGLKVQDCRDPWIISFVSSLSHAVKKSKRSGGGILLMTKSPTRAIAPRSDGTLVCYAVGSTGRHI